MGAAPAAALARTVPAWREDERSVRARQRIFDPPAPSGFWQASEAEAFTPC
jgi:hypothetical protein